jgi:hypothetical protein
LRPAGILPALEDKGKMPSPREAVYVGEPAGKSYLESTGVSTHSYEGGDLSANQVLIVGPGGGQKLTDWAAQVSVWVRAGGNVLAIGLDEADTGAWLPFKIATNKAEHIAAYFEPCGMDSLLTGVGPADVHNRDPRQVPLVARASRPRFEGGTPSTQRGQDGRDTAQIVGDGVLAKVNDANVVFCQLAPWQFDGAASNLRRTHRHVSFLVSRLLANLGVSGSTPLLDRFHQSVDAAKPEKRWSNGLYLDQPEEWDDPYRFFRW